MSDLFDLPPSLSPRLMWFKKYSVTCAWTHQTEFFEEGYLARGRHRGSNFVANAPTEDEAITALAKAMRVPLWNEEGGAG